MRLASNNSANHTRLVKACLDLLRLRGCIGVKVQSGGAWVPADKARTRWRPIALAGGGTVDLIAALPGGLTLWVEIKTGEGDLSQTQRMFRDDLMRLGHRHVVVRDSLDELLSVLKQTIEENR
jgi:hypothetical protein